jgi:hypothetical protein
MLRLSRCCIARPPAIANRLVWLKNEHAQSGNVRPLMRLLVVALLLAAGCGPVAPAGEKSLLAGLRPEGAVDVQNAARLTDGIASYEGDFWDTDLVARLRSVSSYVAYDLGSQRAIRCAFLQGDDNDDYQLSGSLDGVTWTRLWDGRAMPHAGAGMRTRAGQLDGRARYLRLTASGGDGRYTVAELGVYETCPATWPPTLARQRGSAIEDTAGIKIAFFVAAAVLFLFLHRRGGGLVRNLSLLLPLATGFFMVRDLVQLYPFWKLESALRGAIAGIAAVVVLREAFSRPGREPDPRWMKVVLGVLAVGALGCYYHFGALQFFDAAKGRKTLVHTVDMRHYFPLAKYFRELRFDGLYAASMGAYIDLHPGMRIEDVPRVKFRDLRDAEMRPAIEMADHIREVKARFSPERWEEWKRDMRYFLAAMGSRDYLGGMVDHGGNATPVWILAGYALFRHAPASELTLTLAGLIDPLLVLTLIFCVWRAFGVRVMLYTVILFGATDFYQFGTNLVGSTLRQDWLVAAGLGACALRKKRPVLGGVLSRTPASSAPSPPPPPWPCPSRSSGP